MINISGILSVLNPDKNKTSTTDTKISEVSDVGAQEASMPTTKTDIKSLIVEYREAVAGETDITRIHALTDALLDLGIAHFIMQETEIMTLDDQLASSEKRCKMLEDQLLESTDKILEQGAKLATTLEQTGDSRQQFLQELAELPEDNFTQRLLEKLLTIENVPEDLMCKLTTACINDNKQEPKRNRK